MSMLLNLVENSKSYLDNKSITYLKEKISQYYEVLEEFLIEQKRTLNLPSDLLEFWVAKALNGKVVGKGNTAIDVVATIDDRKIGIDVKCMICQKPEKLGNTNETSLLQNFKSCGKNLDQLFASRDFKNIEIQWKDCLYKKLTNCQKKFKLDEILHFYFISTREKVYIYIFKLDLDISTYNSISIIQPRTKKHNVSLHFKNIIDDNFGSVKLYKSKKRLELRLKIKKLNGLEFELVQTKIENKN